MFRILRDVPLTANFERPADPKFLERFDEMDETSAPGGDQGDDSGPVDAMAVSVEAVAGASEEGEDADAADAAEEDLFDPESPEGIDEGIEGPFHEEHGVEYQLLQHVDSPEHEDPDEVPWGPSLGLGPSWSISLFMIIYKSCFKLWDSCFLVFVVDSRF